MLNYTKNLTFVLSTALLDQSKAEKWRLTVWDSSKILMHHF